MIAKREWYKRTEATWPEITLPALTDDEAIRATRKLYRFVLGKACKRKFHVSSGKIYPTIYHKGSGPGLPHGCARVNPGMGWPTLVHALSHDLGGGHSKKHARLEARMIREVLKRGWLDGTLKTEPKPEPTAADRDAKRLAQVEAGIERWERKRKRAETALRKLRRRRNYYLTKGATA